MLKLAGNIFKAFDKEYLPKAGKFTGRGSCLTFACEGIEGKVVARLYRHGGLIGRLAGSLFRDQARPNNELALSAKAVSMGLRAPEALAVIKQEMFFSFFKAALLTKEITNAIDLINAVTDYKSCDFDILREKRGIILKIAREVRKMHDIGICHGDLHLKNILIKRAGNGELEPYIIDLDKSTYSQNLGIKKRLQNLFRLDRSVEKLAIFSKRRVAPESETLPITKIDRIRFFKEYFNGYNESDGGWKEFIKPASSNYKTHKFFWSFTKKN